MEVHRGNNVRGGWQDVGRGGGPPSFLPWSFVLLRGWEPGSPDLFHWVFQLQTLLTWFQSTFSLSQILVLAPVPLENCAVLQLVTYYQSR